MLGVAEGGEGMKRRLTILGCAAAFLVAAFVPTALSTPSSGVTSSVRARGTAVDKIKTRGNQAFDVVVQTITIAPGGSSGWHSHPGQAIVVVKSGTFTSFTLNDPCTPHHYPAGSVYIDPGYGNVHIARNLGSTALELEVTYLDVPIGAPFRTDEAAPATCA